MEGDDAVSYVGPSPHPPGDERNANCQALFLDTSLLQGSGPREAMNDDFTDHRRTIAPITASENDCSLHEGRMLAFEGDAAASIALPLQGWLLEWDFFLAMHAR